MPEPDHVPPTCVNSPPTCSVEPSLPVSSAHTPLYLQQMPGFQGLAPLSRTAPVVAFIETSFGVW